MSKKANYLKSNYPALVEGKNERERMKDFMLRRVSFLEKYNIRFNGLLRQVVENHNYSVYNSSKPLLVHTINNDKEIESIIYYFMEFVLNEKESRDDSEYFFNSYKNIDGEDASKLEEMWLEWYFQYWFTTLQRFNKVFSVRKQLSLVQNGMKKESVPVFYKNLGDGLWEIKFNRSQGLKKVKGDKEGGVLRNNSRNDYSRRYYEYINFEGFTFVFIANKLLEKLEEENKNIFQHFDIDNFTQEEYEFILDLFFLRKHIEGGFFIYFLKILSLLKIFNVKLDKLGNAKIFSDFRTEVFLYEPLLKGLKQIEEKEWLKIRRFTEDGKIDRVLDLLQKEKNKTLLDALKTIYLNKVKKESEDKAEDEGGCKNEERAKEKNKKENGKELLLLKQNKKKVGEILLKGFDILLVLNACPISDCFDFLKLHIKNLSHIMPNYFLLKQEILKKEKVNSSRRSRFFNVDELLSLVENL